MQELVQSFHDAGMVHGDLRDPNIICDDKGRLMLIDFEWAGKDGQVSYPTEDLTEELLKGRTRDDLTITKEDDIRVLKMVLDKLPI